MAFQILALGSFSTLLARSFARNDESLGGPNNTSEMLFFGSVLLASQLEVASTFATVAQSASVAGTILKSSELGFDVTIVKEEKPS